MANKGGGVLPAPAGRLFVIPPKSVPPPLRPTQASWQVEQRLGFGIGFVEHARTVNNRMPEHVVGRITEVLNGVGRPLRGSRLVVLGLTYKAGVNDVRESPALSVLQRLVAAGADCVYHDPFVPRAVVAGRRHGDFVRLPDDVRAEHLPRLESVPLTPELLAGADCVVALRLAGGAPEPGVGGGRDNVAGSAIAREAAAVLPTQAGPEIGVAATRTHVAQVVALQGLALALGEARGTLPPSRSRRIRRALGQLPALVELALGRAPEVLRIADHFTPTGDFFFLGRGRDTPSPWRGPSSSRRRRMSAPRPIPPGSSSTVPSPSSNRAWSWSAWWAPAPRAAACSRTSPRSGPGGDDRAGRSGA